MTEYKVVVNSFIEANRSLDANEAYVGELISPSAIIGPLERQNKLPTTELFAETFHSHKPFIQNDAYYTGHKALLNGGKIIISQVSGIQSFRLKYTPCAESGTIITIGNLTLSHDHAHLIVSGGTNIPWSYDLESTYTIAVNIDEDVFINGVSTSYLHTPFANGNIELGPTSGAFEDLVTFAVKPFGHQTAYYIENNMRQNMLHSEHMLTKRGSIHTELGMVVDARPMPASIRGEKPVCFSSGVSSIFVTPSIRVHETEPRLTFVGDNSSSELDHTTEALRIHSTGGLQLGLGEEVIIDVEPDAVKFFDNTTINESGILIGQSTFLDGEITTVTVNADTFNAGTTTLSETSLDFGGTTTLTETSLGIGGTATMSATSLSIQTVEASLNVDVGDSVKLTGTDITIGETGFDTKITEDSITIVDALSTFEATSESINITGTNANISLISNVNNTNITPTSLAIEDGDNTANITSTSLVVTNGDNTANITSTSLAIEDGSNTANISATSLAIEDGSNNTANISATSLEIADGSNTANISATSLAIEDGSNTANISATSLAIEDGSNNTANITSTSLVVTNGDNTANITSTSLVVTNADNTAAISADAITIGPIELAATGTISSTDFNVGVSGNVIAKAFNVPMTTAENVTLSKDGTQIHKASGNIILPSEPYAGLRYIILTDTGIQIFDAAVLIETIVGKSHTEVIYDGTNWDVTTKYSTNFIDGTPVVEGTNITTDTFVSSVTVHPGTWKLRYEFVYHGYSTCNIPSEVQLEIDEIQDSLMRGYEVTNGSNIHQFIRSVTREIIVTTPITRTYTLHGSKIFETDITAKSSSYFRAMRL